MSENVIDVFSGTGNCLDFARNMAKKMGDTDIIMIRSTLAKEDVRDAKRVGFVFPCFGGGAPEDVLNAAKRIQISPDAYTFAVSISASYAGVGLAALNEIIPLRYWRTTTHHCSCIWLFPHDLMLPKLSVEDAQARSMKTAWIVAAEVLSGKVTGKKPPKNPLNAVENKGWPMIAQKKAAAFKVSGDCIGCGQCARLCPRGNIEVVGGKAVIGTNCAQCLACLQWCPVSAISIGEITKKREHYHNPDVKPDDLCQALIHID